MDTILNTSLVATLLLLAVNIGLTVALHFCKTETAADRIAITSRITIGANMISFIVVGAILFMSWTDGIAKTFLIFAFLTSAYVIYQVIVGFDKTDKNQTAQEGQIA